MYDYLPTNDDFLGGKVQKQIEAIHTTRENPVAPTGHKVDGFAPECEVFRKMTQ